MPYNSSSSSSARFSESFAAGDMQRWLVQVGSLPALSMLLLCMLLLWMGTLPVEAQVTRAGAGLEGVKSGGDTDVADIDGDNDLDIVVAGETAESSPSAVIYRNNGDGDFVPIDANLTGVSWNATADFADVNGDDAPDLLITGQNDSGQPSTTLYINDGTGNFTPVDAGLPDVEEGVVAWGDVDGDTDPDLVLTTTEEVALGEVILYSNDGSGLFSQMNVDLSSASSPETVAFGDYNGDGHLDLFVTGDSSPQLFRNPGDGQFQTAFADLYSAYGSTADWADVDGDGTLDLVVSGGGTNGPATTIYQNQGGGSFAALDAGLVDLRDSSAEFRDINGDGAPDLLVTGVDNSSNDRALLYLNNGSGAFARAEWGMTGVVGGGLAIGDVEPDGDIDFAIVGFDQRSEASARLYVNRQIQNDVPGERARFMRGGGIIDTLAAGINYEDVIEVGDPEGSPIQFRVYAVKSDAELTPTGAGAARLSIPTTRADAGRSFNPLLIATDTNLFEREVSRYAEVRVSQFFATENDLMQVAAFGDGFAKWGDYDRDGDLDLVVSGSTGARSVSTQLYENTGGSLSPVDAGVPNLDGEAAEWGDIDGDGDLDLVITTEDATTIITNNDGTFEPTTSLPGARVASSLWKDFDRDGDLDWVMVGGSGGGPALFYENMGSGQFEPQEAGLPNIGYGVAASGDVDRDGIPDLLLAGLDGNGESQTLIYTNDGDANFSVTSNDLPGTALGAADFGDFDQDGDLDLVLTGINDPGNSSQDESRSAVAEVFANDGSGMFEPVDAGLAGSLLSTNGFTRTTAQWGDLDADGDLDVVVGDGPTSETERDGQ